MKQTRYVFVTGGVVSGLGKGIASASIGALLKKLGFKVAAIKVDPYLNIDPGTQNPYQHGEVFVTEDGCETDLDLGHYERFLDEPCCSLSNMTSGQIYSTILEKERKGDYQGQTVQVIPHVTQEIQRRIIKLAQKKDADIVLCEIGGTVGDIESQPFLEAIRQMSKRVGRENCCYVHLTLVPYISSSGEVKTKPTQHSVRDLRAVGIYPDIIICRTPHKAHLDDDLKKKISLFCDVDPEDVIEGTDVDDIYEVPTKFLNQDVHMRVLEKINLVSATSIAFSVFEEYVKKSKALKHAVDSTVKVSRDGFFRRNFKIAIIGKYVECKDAYISIEESIKHAAVSQNMAVDILKIDAEDFEKFSDDVKKDWDGIVVPGGFGERGIEGKILAAKYCRENNVPYLGICLGLQIAVIEFARNICGLDDANSTEFDSSCLYPVIDLMENQKSVTGMGGTMRLGDFTCKLKRNSLVGQYYNEDVIVERHRHRYEFNDEFENIMEENGLVVVGRDELTGLVEIVENKNQDFFVGVQFHPEFKSRPFGSRPVFVGFLDSMARKAKNGRQ